MLTRAQQPPDDRGTRWLKTKAPPRFAGDASCYWGTEQETQTTLYLRLAGDPDLKALRFPPDMIAGCGSGRYPTQAQALLFIRRALRKMGVLHT